MTAKSYRPEYRHWVNMKSRCNYKHGPYERLYQSRGITICDRWNESFDAFFEDVGPRPSPEHSIDRIDVNGNYEPGNVRWATHVEQCRNTRSNKIVSVLGKDMPLVDAVEQYSTLTYNTVLWRIKRGWPVELALTRPPSKGVRPKDCA